MPILAALQPGVTLDLYLRGKGGAMCPPHSPRQCLAPCQEAQHPIGITGDSDDELLLCLITCHRGLALQGGPGSGSVEGPLGWMLG